MDAKGGLIASAGGVRGENSAWEDCTVDLHPACDRGVVTADVVTRGGVAVGRIVGEKVRTCVAVESLKDLPACLSGLFDLLRVDHSSLEKREVVACLHGWIPIRERAGAAPAGHTLLRGAIAVNAAGLGRKRTVLFASASGTMQLVEKLFERLVEFQAVKVLAEHRDGAFGTLLGTVHGKLGCGERDIIASLGSRLWRWTGYSPLRLDRNPVHCLAHGCGRRSHNLHVLPTFIKIVPDLLFVGLLCWSRLWGLLRSLILSLLLADCLTHEGNT